MSVDREELISAFDRGCGLLIERANGEMSADELQDALVMLFAEGVDAATDTGPFDEIDGKVIKLGVAALYELTDDLIERDPTKIRARAEKDRLRGKTKKAQRRIERAVRIEARRASKRG